MSDYLYYNYQCINNHHPGIVHNRAIIANVNRGSFNIQWNDVYPDDPVNDQNLIKGQPMRFHYASDPPYTALPSPHRLVGFGYGYNSDSSEIETAAGQNNENAMPLRRLTKQSTSRRRQPFCITTNGINVIPVWFPSFLSGIVPVVAIPRWLRRRHRSRFGLCASCGYDLRASSGRCPECGKAKDATAHHLAGRRREAEATCRTI